MHMVTIMFVSILYVEHVFPSSKDRRFVSLNILKRTWGANHSILLLIYSLHFRKLTVLCGEMWTDYANEFLANVVFTYILSDKLLCNRRLLLLFSRL